MATADTIKSRVEQTIYSSIRTNTFQSGTSCDL